MADLVFVTALGRAAALAALPAANDALVIVPIETTGIVGDATMRDYATLADLLAGPSNEQTTMGRKVLSGVAVTVNTTSDRVEIDAADVTWIAAAGNPVSALVVCYDPDTTTGTDADLIPLSKHDFVLTPDGADVTATITDLIRATSAA